MSNLSDLRQLHSMGFAFKAEEKIKGSTWNLELDTHYVTSARLTMSSIQRYLEHMDLLQVTSTDTGFQVTLPNKAKNLFVYMVEFVRTNPEKYAKLILTTEQIKRITDVVPRVMSPVEECAVAARDGIVASLTEQFEGVLVSTLSIQDIIESTLLKFELARMMAGTMTGLQVAAGIGQPITQMALKSLDWTVAINLKSVGSDQVTTHPIGQWIDQQLQAAPELIQLTQENQTEYLALTEPVHILSTNDHGQVAWHEVVAVTRHLPTGKLVEITTETGRRVIASQQKSFLVHRIIDDVETLLPIDGCEIRVGDYVPVSLEEPLETSQHFLHDVLLDQVVAVRYVDSTHEYVYDLTVPATLNFAVASGIHCRDTFHEASSIKSVSSGIKSIQERLGASAHLQNESSTVIFKESMTFEKIIGYKGSFVESKVMDLVASYRVAKPFDLGIEWWHHAYQIQTQQSYQDKAGKAMIEVSWVLRLYMDINIMYARNIQLADVVETINKDNSDQVFVIPSPRELHCIDVYPIEEEIPKVLEKKLQKVWSDSWNKKKYEGKDSGSKFGEFSSLSNIEDVGISVMLQQIVVPTLRTMKIKGVSGISDVFPVEVRIFSTQGILSEKFDRIEKRMWYRKLVVNRHADPTMGLTTRKIIKSLTTHGYQKKKIKYDPDTYTFMVGYTLNLFADKPPVVEWGRLVSGLTAKISQLKNPRVVESYVQDGKKWIITLRGQAESSLGELAKTGLKTTVDATELTITVADDVLSRWETLLAAVADQENYVFDSTTGWAIDLATTDLELVQGLWGSEKMLQAISETEEGIRLQFTTKHFMEKPPSQVARENIEIREKAVTSKKLRRLLASDEEETPEEVVERLRASLVHFFAETNGSNLEELLASPLIDSNRTICNNVQKMYEIFGIEAAREFLTREIKHVIVSNRGNTNDENIALIADWMTNSGVVVPVTSLGMARQPTSALTKAAMERAFEVFSTAAATGAGTITRAVTPAIYMGRRANGGTGYFEIVPNQDLIKAESARTEEMARKVRKYTKESDPASPSRQDLMSDDLDTYLDTLSSKEESEMDLNTGPDLDLDATFKAKPIPYQAALAKKTKTPLPKSGPPKPPSPKKSLKELVEESASDEEEIVIAKPRAKPKAMSRK